MLTEQMNFSPRLTAFAKEVERDCKPVFERIDEICEYNEARVLSAFMECGSVKRILLGLLGMVTATAAGKCWTRYTPR